MGKEDSYCDLAFTDHSRASHDPVYHCGDCCRDRKKKKNQPVFFFVSSSTVLSFAQVCAGMLLLFLLAMGKGS